MTSEELRALIEEVEACVDSAQPRLANRCHLACGFWWNCTLDVWERNDGKRVRNCLDSRDDADALLGKGWRIVDIRHSPAAVSGKRWTVELYRQAKPYHMFGFGNTEPCARTAAALRAELRRMEG